MNYFGMLMKYGLNPNITCILRKYISTDYHFCHFYMNKIPMQESFIYAFNPQVIQKRSSRNVDFNQSWADYKTGFGAPDDEYWIGMFSTKY
jgi:hypothetical protein